MPDTPNKEAASAAPANNAPAATPSSEQKVLSTAISRLTGRAPKTDETPPSPASNETKKEGAATPVVEAPAAAAGAAATPAAAQPAAAADASKATDRVRKVSAAPTAPAQTAAPSAEEIAREVVRQQQVQKPAPTEDDHNLAPEDRQELELASYAATKKEDRYKDLPGKLKGYFKKRDELLVTKASELGGADSAEFREYLESEDYKMFVRANRPGFHRGDRAELERSKIEEDALAKADLRVKATEQKLQRQINEVKLAPVIEATVNSAVSDLLQLEDEVVQAYKADPNKALAERKLEAQEVENAAVALRLASSEYLKIHHNLVDPNPKNPLHTFLDNFISNQGVLLDQKPEAERKRDGKLLVSPERFHELEKQGKADGYTTFSDADVITMLTTFSKKLLPTGLDGVRKSIEGSGYQRVKKAPTDDAQKGAESTDVSSPKASASRSPGPSEKPAVAVPRHIALLTGRKS